MYVIKTSNVNGALFHATMLMQTSSLWRKIAPRDGKVTYEFKEPVTTVYTRPWQRVLFDERRDANPFFHLFEAMWMLAGRNDAEWLSQFSSKIGQYAEDDGHFHGAYGYRWRSHFTSEERGHYDPAFRTDQVSELITLLRNAPDTRRAVLAMWDPASDLNIDARDIPCNTHIYFKRRGDWLNMLVSCRSNDLILGCYGANAVHFSVLQEYVAAALECAVGTYTHVSDSWHFYEDNPYAQYVLARRDQEQAYTYRDYYTPGHGPQIGALELFGDFENVAHDLTQFMHVEWDDVAAYKTYPFQAIMYPMRNAYSAYKKKDYGTALTIAKSIASPDWRIACTEWLERRAAS